MGIVLDVSADTSRAEQALDKIKTKVSSVDKGLSDVGGIRQINDNLTQMNKKIDGATAGLKRFVRQAVSFGTIIGLTRKFNSVLDYQISALNKMAVVVGRGSALNKNMNSLYDILRRTGGSTEMATDSFARLKRSLGDKYTTPQYLKATESLLKAVAISGGPAASAEAALFQLSQGLAAGQLRGQELNSVMEQTPRVARAIADELKAGIGQLRAMAMEGKITAKVVMSAMLNQAEKLNSEFSEVQFTIGMAKKTLETSIFRFLHHLDESSGYSRMVVKNTQELAAFFDNLSKNSDAFVAVMVRIVNLYKTFRQVMNFLMITVVGLTRLLYNSFVAIQRYLPEFRLARWTVIADMTMQVGLLYRQLVLVSPLYKDLLYLVGGKFFGSHRKALSLFQAGSLEEYAAAWKELGNSVTRFEESTFGVYRRFHRRIRLMLYEGYKFLGWWGAIEIPLFDFFAVGNWRLGFRHVQYYFSGIYDAIRTVGRMIQIVVASFIYNLMTIQSVQNFVHFMSPLKVFFITLKTLIQAIYVLIRTAIHGFLTLGMTIIQAFSALGNVSAGPLKERMDKFYQILYIGFTKVLKLVADDLISPIWFSVKKLYSELVYRLVSFFHSGHFTRVAKAIGNAFLNLLAGVGAVILLAVMGVKELIQGLFVSVSNIRVNFSFESIKLLPEYKRRIQEKIRELFSNTEGPGLLSKISLDISFGSFDEFFQSLRISFADSMSFVQSKIKEVHKDVKGKDFTPKFEQIDKKTLGQYGMIAFQEVKTFGDMVDDFLNALGTDLKFVMLTLLHVILTGNKLVSFLVILSHAWPELLSSASNLVSTLKGIFYDLGDFIGTAIVGAFANLPRIFESILEIADSFVDGLLEPFGMLGDVLKGILDIFPLLKIPIMLMGLSLFTGNFTKFKSIGKTFMGMWSEPKKGGKKGGMLSGMFYSQDSYNRRTLPLLRDADKREGKYAGGVTGRLGASIRESSGKQKLLAGGIGAAALVGMTTNPDFGMGETLTSISTVAFMLFAHEIPNLLLGVKDMVLEAFNPGGIEKLGKHFGKMWSQTTNRMNIYFTIFTSWMAKKLALINLSSFSFSAMWAKATAGAARYFSVTNPGLGGMIARLGVAAMASAKWLIPLGIAAAALAVVFGATSAAAGDMSNVDMPSDFSQGFVDAMTGPIATITGALTALGLTIWGITKWIRRRSAASTVGAASATPTYGFMAPSVAPQTPAAVTTPAPIPMVSGKPTGMAATGRMGGLMWLGMAGAIILLLSQIFEPFQEAVEGIVEVFDGWIIVMASALLFTGSFVNLFKKLYIYMRSMVTGNRVAWRDIQQQDGQFVIQQSSGDNKSFSWSDLNPFSIDPTQQAAAQQAAIVPPVLTPEEMKEERKQRRRKIGARVAGGLGTAMSFAFIPTMFMGATGFGGEILDHLTAAVGAIGLVMLAFKTQIGNALAAALNGLGWVTKQAGGFLGNIGKLIGKLWGLLKDKSTWIKLGKWSVRFFFWVGLAVSGILILVREFTNYWDSAYRSVKRNAKKIRKMQEDLNETFKVEDYAHMSGYGKTGVPKINDILAQIDPSRTSSDQLSEVNRQLENIGELHKANIETYKKEGKLTRWELYKITKAVNRMEDTAKQGPPAALGDNQDILLNRKLHEYYRQQGVIYKDIDRILGTKTEWSVSGPRVHDPKQMNVWDKLFYGAKYPIKWFGSQFGGETRSAERLRNLDPLTGDLAFFSKNIKNLQVLENQYPSMGSSFDALKSSQIAQMAFTDLDVLADVLASIPRGKRGWQNQLVMQPGTVPLWDFNFDQDSISNVLGIFPDAQSMSKSTAKSFHAAVTMTNQAQGYEVNLRRANRNTLEFSKAIAEESGNFLFAAKGYEKEFSIAIQTLGLEMQQGKYDLESEKGRKKFQETLVDRLAGAEPEKGGVGLNKELVTRLVGNEKSLDAIVEHLKGVQVSSEDLQASLPEVLAKVSGEGLWDRLWTTRGGKDKKIWFTDTVFAEAGLSDADVALLDAALGEWGDSLHRFVDEVNLNRKRMEVALDRFGMAGLSGQQWDNIVENLSLDKILEEAVDIQGMVGEDPFGAQIYFDKVKALDERFKALQEASGFEKQELLQMDALKLGLSPKLRKELEAIKAIVKDLEKGAEGFLTQTQHINNEIKFAKEELRLWNPFADDADVGAYGNMLLAAQETGSKSHMDRLLERGGAAAVYDQQRQNQFDERNRAWHQATFLNAEDIHLSRLKEMSDLVGAGLSIDAKFVSPEARQNLNALLADMHDLQTVLLHDPGNETFIHKLDMAVYDTNLNLMKTIELLSDTASEIQGIATPEWLLASGGDLGLHRELHRNKARLQSLSGLIMEEGRPSNLGVFENSSWKKELDRLSINIETYAKEFVSLEGSVAASASETSSALDVLAQGANSAAVALQNISGRQADTSKMPTAKEYGEAVQQNRLGRKDGGFVSGAGTGRSDSIPAMLSNGEYVINAASTSKFFPLLERINSGGIRLADGGYMGSPYSNREEMIGSFVDRLNKPRGPVGEFDLESATALPWLLAALPWAGRAAWGLGKKVIMNPAFKQRISTNLLRNQNQQAIQRFLRLRKPANEEAVLTEEGASSGGYTNSEDLFKSGFVRGDRYVSPFNKPEKNTGFTDFINWINNQFPSDGITQGFDLSAIDPFAIFGLKDGGFVSGAGGPRSDSIPAMLSNGEYVVNASSTKKFLPLLEEINSGTVGLKDGGDVGGGGEYKHSLAYLKDLYGDMVTPEQLKGIASIFAQHIYQQSRLDAGPLSKKLKYMFTAPEAGGRRFHDPSQVQGGPKSYDTLYKEMKEYYNSLSKEKMFSQSRRLGKDGSAYSYPSGMERLLSSLPAGRGEYNESSYRQMEDFFNDKSRLNDQKAFLDNLRDVNLSIPSEKKSWINNIRGFFKGLRKESDKAVEESLNNVSSFRSIGKKNYLEDMKETEDMWKQVSEHHKEINSIKPKSWFQIDRWKENDENRKRRESRDAQLVYQRSRYESFLENLEPLNMVRPNYVGSNLSLEGRVEAQKLILLQRTFNPIIGELRGFFSNLKEESKASVKQSLKNVSEFQSIGQKNYLDDVKETEDVWRQVSKYQKEVIKVKPKSFWGKVKSFFKGNKFPDTPPPGTNVLQNLLDEEEKRLRIEEEIVRLEKDRKEYLKAAFEEERGWVGRLWEDFKSGFGGETPKPPALKEIKDQVIETMQTISGKNYLDDVKETEDVWRQVQELKDEKGFVEKIWQGFQDLYGRFKGVFEGNKFPDTPPPGTNVLQNLLDEEEKRFRIEEEIVRLEKDRQEYLKAAFEEEKSWVEDIWQGVMETFSKKSSSNSDKKSLEKVAKEMKVFRHLGDILPTLIDKPEQTTQQPSTFSLPASLEQLDDMISHGFEFLQTKDLVPSDKKEDAVPLLQKDNRNQEFSQQIQNANNLPVFNKPLDVSYLFDISETEKMWKSAAKIWEEMVDNVKVVAKEKEDRVEEMASERLTGGYSRSQEFKGLKRNLEDIQEKYEGFFKEGFLNSEDALKVLFKGNNEEVFKNIQSLTTQLEHTTDVNKRAEISKNIEDLKASLTLTEDQIIQGLRHTQLQLLEDGIQIAINDATIGSIIGSLEKGFGNVEGMWADFDFAKQLYDFDVEFNDRRNEFLNKIRAGDFESAQDMVDWARNQKQLRKDMILDRGQSLSTSHREIQGILSEFGQFDSEAFSGFAYLQDTIDYLGLDHLKIPVLYQEWMEDARRFDTISQKLEILENKKISELTEQDIKNISNYRKELQMIQRTAGNIPNLNLVGADDFEDLLSFTTKDFSTVLSLSGILHEIEQIDQAIAGISLDESDPEQLQRNIDTLNELKKQRDDLMVSGQDVIFDPSRNFLKLGLDDIFDLPEAAEDFETWLEDLFTLSPKIKVDWSKLGEFGLTGEGFQNQMDLAGMGIDMDEWLVGAQAIGDVDEMALRLLATSDKMMALQNKLRKAMEGTFDPQRIAEVKREMQDLMNGVQDSLDHINFWSEEFKEEFHGNMVEVIKGTKSVSEGFRSMFDTMINHLISRITKDLADAFYDSMIAPSGGGGIGGIFTFLFGGLKSGGKVEGHGGTQGDKIPVRLSSGEYVINAKSTRKYLPLIERINEGTLGLSDGGPVGVVQESTFEPYVIATMDLIKQFEGFLKYGVPDAFKVVNGKVERNWDDPNSVVRGGWSSDTITDPISGMIRQVTLGMEVTRAEADADLRRRTSEEFLPRVQRQVGMDVFQGLEDYQKASLGSIAYQWGSLPKSIAEAVRSGSQKDVVKAILKTGENQVWHNRHMVTAGIYGNGMKIEANNADEAREALMAHYDLTKEEFQKTRWSLVRQGEGNFAVKTLSVGVKTAKDGGDGSDPKTDPNADPKKEEGKQQGILGRILNGGGAGGIFGGTALNRDERQNMDPGTGFGQMANAFLAPQSFFLHQLSNTIVDRVFGKGRVADGVKAGLAMYFGANYFQNLGDLWAGEKDWGSFTLDNLVFNNLLTGLRPLSEALLGKDNFITKGIDFVSNIGTKIGDWTGINSLFSMVGGWLTGLDPKDRSPEAQRQKAGLSGLLDKLGPNLKNALGGALAGFLWKFNPLVGALIGIFRSKLPKINFRGMFGGGRNRAPAFGDPSRQVRLQTDENMGTQFDPDSGAVYNRHRNTYSLGGQTYDAATGTPIEYAPMRRPGDLGQPQPERKKGFIGRVGDWFGNLFKRKDRPDPSAQAVKSTRGIVDAAGRATSVPDVHVPRFGGGETRWALSTRYSKNLNLKGQGGKSFQNRFGRAPANQEELRSHLNDILQDRLDGGGKKGANYFGVHGDERRDSSILEGQAPSSDFTPLMEAGNRQAAAIDAGTRANREQLSLANRHLDSSNRIEISTLASIDSLNKETKAGLGRNEYALGVQTGEIQAGDGRIVGSVGGLQNAVTPQLAALASGVVGLPGELAKAIKDLEPKPDPSPPPPPARRPPPGGGGRDDDDDDDDRPRTPAPPSGKYNYGRRGGILDPSSRGGSSGGRNSGGRSGGWGGIRGGNQGRTTTGTFLRAKGGYISGAGGPTSDLIPAMLSNGEFVINAASTAKFLPLLERINSGDFQGFSTGGYVGSPSEVSLGLGRELSGWLTRQISELDELNTMTALKKELQERISKTLIGVDSNTKEGSKSIVEKIAEVILSLGGVKTAIGGIRVGSSSMGGMFSPTKTPPPPSTISYKDSLDWEAISRKIFGRVRSYLVQPGENLPEMSLYNAGRSVVDLRSKVYKKWHELNTGGYISGAGGPTSDSIPAMLSNGEYVINSASTRKFLPLLEKINSGDFKGFATGGGPGFTSPTPTYSTGERELGLARELSGWMVKQIAELKDIKTSSKTSKDFLNAIGKILFDTKAQNKAGTQSIVSKIAEQIMNLGGVKTAIQGLRIGGPAPAGGGGRSPDSGGGSGSGSGSPTSGSGGRQRKTWAQVSMEVFGRVRPYIVRRGETVTFKDGSKYTIRSQQLDLRDAYKHKFSFGGFVSGPGSSMSDSIPAMLSNGEFVINAAATRKFKPLLEKINDGSYEKKMLGGAVGVHTPSARPVQETRNTDNSTNVVVNLRIDGNVTEQTRREVHRMIPEIAHSIPYINQDRGRGVR